MPIGSPEDWIKKGSHLESVDKDSHGSIVFDRARGRVVEATLQTVMQGVLLLKEGRQETSYDVVQTEVLKLTTSDEMPELP